MPLIRDTVDAAPGAQPTEVGLFAALRTKCDRIMVQARLLGLLRHSEVLGLRLKDARVGERWVFIADS